jgi:hypothetical protein
MYRFACSNGHTSYSASKEQTDPACPECGEPSYIVSEEPDKPTPETELNENDVRKFLDPRRAS